MGRGGGINEDAHRAAADGLVVLRAAALQREVEHHGAPGPDGFDREALGLGLDLPAADGAADCAVGLDERLRAGLARRGAFVLQHDRRGKGLAAVRECDDGPMDVPGGRGANHVLPASAGFSSLGRRTGIWRTGRPVAWKTALAMAGRDDHDRRFAGAGRRKVGPVEQVNVELGDVPEPRHEVLRERRVEDDALLELHFLAQRRAEAHEQAAVDLRGEVGGVEDGAALEDFARAADGDLALLDGDLDARGDARSLLGAAGEAHADGGVFLPAAAGPVEALGGGFQDGAEARVVQVGEAELERVAAGGGGELVHEGLAGEVVGRRGEGAVGADPQGRIGRHELRLGVAGAVRRGDRGAAGVDVDVEPGGERPRGIEAGLEVDDGGGAEVGPGEFLTARPADEDGLAGGAGEARGLDARLGGVPAAEPAAEVGHDDAHVAGVQAEGARDLVPAAERVLRREPDGDLAAVPFRERGAGFQRRVLDVGDVVGLSEGLGGRGDIGGEGILRDRFARVPAQIVEHRIAVGLGRGLPCGGLGPARPRPARRRTSSGRRRRRTTRRGRTPRPGSPGRRRGRGSSASRRRRAAGADLP